MSRFFRKFCLITMAAAAAFGCSGTIKKEEREYVASVRQLPPEPVYNRLRNSELPSPLPDRAGPDTVGPSFQPVVHLDLKNATLEEAAEALASFARYRAYTSGLIASQRITFNQLGTIDELANGVSSHAGIKVVIDHVNREVRFLAQGGVPPVLKQGLPEGSNEHQSSH